MINKKTLALIVIIFAYCCNWFIKEESEEIKDKNQKELLLLRKSINWFIKEESEETKTQKELLLLRKSLNYLNQDHLKLKKEIFDWKIK